jgi:hypothetical protein
MGHSLWGWDKVADIGHRISIPARNLVHYGRPSPIGGTCPVIPASTSAICLT